MCCSTHFVAVVLHVQKKRELNSSVATGGEGARAPYRRQAWPQDSCRSEDIFWKGERVGVVTASSPQTHRLDFWSTMASAEGGSMPSGVGYGEGCPLSSRLRVWGSVVSSPSGVRSRASAENGFWRILKAT